MIRGRAVTNRRCRTGEREGGVVQFYALKTLADLLL
jgi:hypothetical protein